MDVLGNVLSSMKLSGSVFLEARFSAPWCVASQIAPDDCAIYFPMPAHVISFHYVVAGRCQCAVGDGEPVDVAQGHIILVTRNEQHRLGSDIALDFVHARTLLQPAEDGGLPQIVWGGGGEPTVLFCGFLGTLTPVNAFLLSLPPMLVIDASRGTAGEWLASSIRFAASRPKVESAEMLGRLAELLFAEAVRQYVDELPDGHTGWFAGLRDPHVSRALTLLHGRPADAWTMEDLAREVGLSRSALADRFATLLGEPPMRYLARHRMNVAANMLQEGRDNASNIAYAVGFNSEAAFSRAFKKEFGLAPGAWRREHCAFA